MSANIPEASGNPINTTTDNETFIELPSNEKLRLAYKNLEVLRQLSGGYIASPYNGKNGGDRYNVFWLRDIMYATYANEYVGAFDKMIESYRLILRIFQKHRHKISSGARKHHFTGSCAKEVIHARVHPITLEELTHQWGHHQLDIFGLFLYKTGDLIKKGHNVMSAYEEEDMILLRDIVLYLSTVKWHKEPDFGVWEEGPELHSSSIGSVLAGLTMWHDDGHYHHKYPYQIDLYDYLPVPEEFLIKGQESLTALLPSESKSRPFDLVQLSLIWPYNIISEAQSRTILTNIEENLVRDKGVIRYHGDLYYNANPNKPKGNEAEWPLGLAWLSIAYSKLAVRSIRTGGFFTQLSESLDKAMYYLERLEEVMTPDGKVPELYSGGVMNANVPLAWAQSFYVVAHQSLSHACETLDQKFTRGEQL